MKNIICVILICLIFISLFAGPLITIYTEKLIYMVIMVLSIPLFFLWSLVNAICNIQQEQRKQQEQQADVGAGVHDAIKRAKNLHQKADEN